MVTGWGLLALPHGVILMGEGTAFSSLSREERGLRALVDPGPLWIFCRPFWVCARVYSTIAPKADGFPARFNFKVKLETGFKLETGNRINWS